MYPIRYYGDPVLRKVARPVTVFDDNLKQLAADLITTMYEANGVGLAAPQIGLSKRLFVALETSPTEAEETADEAEASSPPRTPEEKRKRWGVVAEHVMINPTIVQRSGTQQAQDGCLSMPGLYVEKITRAREVTVRYQDVAGAWHERRAEGHFAHVIQHEADHLDGVLFIDRLPEAERRAFMEAHRTELAELQRNAKALLKQLKREPLALEVR